MLRFALQSFSLFFFWHLAWRVFYHGIIRQSGFDLAASRFYLLGTLTDLLVILPLTIFLCGVWRLSKPLAKSFLVFVLFACSVGFITVSGYFPIFEKPAELATVGAGLGSVSSEFFYSAIKEFSREILWFTAGTLLATFGVALAWRRPKFLKPALGLLFVCTVIARFTMSAPPVFRDTQDWQETIHTNPFIYLYERTALHTSMQRGAAHFPKRVASELWRAVSKLNHALIPATPVKRQRYNVIFYIMESTSHEYVAKKVHGQMVMPNFNRLKNHSLVFNKHYTQFPLSVNARYTALLSAYNPPNKNWIPLSEPHFPAQSIFEVLKDAGYRTALFHTASLENWNYRDFLSKRRLDVAADMYALASPQFPKTSGFSIDDRAYIPAALDFIRVSKNTPWFITFLPVMPHHPYTIPFPEFHLYSEKEVLEAPTRAERLLREYLNSLHYADHVLGELVKALDEAHELDNTLLFVFADHGEAFYQHTGNYLHALKLYEENVATPFLIFNRTLFSHAHAYPGITRHIDIAPTALDMLGLKAPTSFMGISLIRAHKARSAYFHTDWEDDISGVRDGAWKYIYSLTPSRSELYNLAEDPGEKQNVLSNYPKIAEALNGEVLEARNTQRQWYERFKKR